MDHPAIRILFLEQGNRSLKDHTKDFVFLAPVTHYPDGSLCSFCRTGLNPTTRAQLSGDEYIERDDTSRTPDPEPSQTTLQLAEPEPEPTADGEPEPRATEPSPTGATAQEIATEPEPSESYQVREPATEPATVDVPVGCEGAKDSTAHCTTAEGEQCLDLGQLHMEQDLIDFTEDIEMELPACLELPVCSEYHLEHDLIDFSEDIEMEFPACPEQSVCLELSTCLNFPPTLPLLSPSSSPAASALPPLFPDRPSAHPQPTICAVGSPQVCQSPSASWLEDPSSSPPAPESRTPPLTLRLHPGSQLPRLHRHPSAHQLHWAPSSLRLRLGRSSSRHHLRTPLLEAVPRRSVPPAPLGSSLPPAPPQSSCCSGSAVDLRSSTSVARALGSASALQILGVAQDHWLSVSASGSTCSAAVTLPPPWLLPPSAPPWATIMAAAWVSPGSSCSGFFLSPPWLFPLSDPPWTFFILLPDVRVPPKPPP
ncbi:hypothetical protein M9458_002858, partial [Cirrhinus mrigala]